MEKLGEILSRMMLDIENKKAGMASILSSIESYLQNERYGEARKMWKEARPFFYDAEDFDLVIPLFLKYPPSGKGCPDCGQKIDFEFYAVELEWFEPPCPNCEGKRIRKIIYENRAKRKTERGVPLRYANANISDFPDRYKKFLGQDSGLYIYGPRGVGKTHLMAALMEEEIINTPPKKSKSYWSTNHNRIRVEYDEPVMDSYPLMISVPEFLTLIRKEIDRGGEEKVLDKYSEVSVLFLDDLGAEKRSEWVEQTLYLLCDRRYNAMRKTFISSNLSLDQIAKKLNDRISSRIAGMCEVLKMEGRDRRLK